MKWTATPHIYERCGLELFIRNSENNDGSVVTKNLGILRHIIEHLYHLLGSNPNRMGTRVRTC
ncbi:MAG: hypothetical protein PVF48_14585, partial [Syntrophobacterales bacterium]